MLKSILIIDSEDEIYNSLFLFDNEKKFQEAMKLVKHYEEVLEHEYDCDDEDEDTEEYLDEQDVWTDTYDALANDLSAAHYQGMPEGENDFDYVITR